MFGFGKKKSTLKVDYDPAKQKPVFRCSICTGEQVACLKDLRSGALTEIMAIRSPEDAERFKEACGVTDIEKVY